MNKLMIISVLFVVVLLLAAGCEPDYSASSGAVRGAITEFESFKAYQPVKAVFLPLSDVRPPDKPHKPDTIIAYVALQDGTVRCFAGE